MKTWSDNPHVSLTHRYYRVSIRTLFLWGRLSLKSKTDQIDPDDSLGKFNVHRLFSHAIISVYVQFTLDPTKSLILLLNLMSIKSAVKILLSTSISATYVQWVSGAQLHIIINTPPEPLQFFYSLNKASTFCPRLSGLQIQNYVLSWIPHSLVIVMWPYLKDRQLLVSQFHLSNWQTRLTENNLRISLHSKVLILIDHIQWP